MGTPRSRRHVAGTRRRCETRDAKRLEGGLRLVEIFLQQQARKAWPDPELADRARRTQIVILIQDRDLDQRIWAPINPFGNGAAVEHRTSDRPARARIPSLADPRHTSRGVPSRSTNWSIAPMKAEPDLVCRIPRSRSRPRSDAPPRGGWPGNGCMCTLVNALARSPARGSPPSSYGVITSSSMQAERRIRRCVPGIGWG